MVMPGTKCGVLILRSLGALPLTRRLPAEGEWVCLEEKQWLFHPHLELPE